MITHHAAPSFFVNGSKPFSCKSAPRSKSLAEENIKTGDYAKPDPASHNQADRFRRKKDKPAEHLFCVAKILVLPRNILRNQPWHCDNPNLQNKASANLQEKRVRGTIQGFQNAHKHEDKKKLFLQI